MGASNQPAKYANSDRPAHPGGATTEHSASQQSSEQRSDISKPGTNNQLPRQSPRGQNSPKERSLNSENQSRNSPKQKEKKGDKEESKSSTSTNNIGKFSTKLLEEGLRTGINKEDFRILSVLDQGSYGKVVQVSHVPTNQIYAMKIIKKDTVFRKKQEEHARTERRILERINHPLIASLHFAFETPSRLYLVMDYFNGGELFFHLKNARGFTEERANFYIAEVLLALEHLHSLNIIYRDLKPENVLLDDKGHIKLMDSVLRKEQVNLPYGTNLELMAYLLSKEEVILPYGNATFCGTPAYLAPEVLHGNPYGQPIDI